MNMSGVRSPSAYTNDIARTTQQTYETATDTTNTLQVQQQGQEGELEMEPYSFNQNDSNSGGTDIANLQPE
jgi:hypothetical protein